MSDMQPILRRKPGDYLPRPTQPQTAVTVRGAAPVPPGARGTYWRICAQLDAARWRHCDVSITQTFIALLSISSSDTTPHYNIRTYLSSKGLCPELQSLFAMTMTSSNSGLPFPLKKGEVVRSSSVGAHGGVGASRESIGIDAVRDNSYEVSKVKFS